MNEACFAIPAVILFIVGGTVSKRNPESRWGTIAVILSILFCALTIYLSNAQK